MAAPLEVRPPALFVMITMYIICRYLHLITRIHSLGLLLVVNIKTLSPAPDAALLTLTTLSRSSQPARRSMNEVEIILHVLVLLLHPNVIHCKINSKIKLG